MKFVSFNLNPKGKLFRLGDSTETRVWFIGIIEVFVSSMVGPLFQDQFWMGLQREKNFNYALIP
jgi:hypothetical protein